MKYTVHLVHLFLSWTLASASGCCIDAVATRVLPITADLLLMAKITLTNGSGSFQDVGVH